LLVAHAPLAPCRAGEPASALDRLDPSAIPTEERAAGQPRDLVGLLGSHRGRHWGHVFCLAYSPDGKGLASGGEERASTCGTPPRCARWPCCATPTASLPWPSAPTAGRWPPAPTTAPSGSGTCAAAGPGSEPAGRRTNFRFRRWRSRPTAGG